MAQAGERFKGGGERKLEGFGFGEVGRLTLDVRNHVWTAFGPGTPATRFIFIHAAWKRVPSSMSPHFLLANQRSSISFASSQHWATTRARSAGLPPRSTALIRP